MRQEVAALPRPYFEDERAGITIYHGDALDILPQLEPGSVDLVLTDPPYGMNWDGRVTRGKNGTGKAGPTRHYGMTIVDDDKPFDPSPWLSFPKVILWGFHHFSSRLPEGSLLIWLKRYDDGFGSFLSDADTAWMKGGCGVYCRRDLSLQGESSQRVHPTQKPLGLMRWCMEIANLSVDAVILDPFMGSGTTLRAAKDLGRRAIGIEIEERYCEIAAKRLAQGVLAL
jgi:site-specific DNA-methyltransferase (adenine-specific)